MIGRLLLISLFSTLVVYTQEIVEYKEIPEDLRPFIYASDNETNWFTNAKFGVFMHWGPYSQAKVPASWGRFGNRPGAGKQATKGIPEEEYDNLFKSFNPSEFNADEWIKMVKDAGAKYFIFTTKHHDGFCMFDAKNTDYKITNTPFGRDVAKELADACHKYGIKLFWYYSQPDWKHPDCLTENNARYREYMFAQLEQLLTEYGKISGLFFDGLGTKYYHWDTPRMLKMIRTLQPGIIINRRWGGGMPGFPVQGDYDNPEQEFGIFEVNRPWEMCATISEAWSWTGGETFKSYHANQRIFIRTVCSGGNLALNTGPSPKGYINPPEVEIYTNIGNWLEKYGESIYDTKGGPYKPGAWGGATCYGNKIYLHILTHFAEGVSKTITLPTLPVRIRKARLLTGGEVVISESNKKLTINLSGNLNTLDNILELEVDTLATQLDPVDTQFTENEILDIMAASSSDASEKFSVEKVFKANHGEFAEGKRHKIWWSPGNDDKQPWIEAKFPYEVSIDYIMLAEQIRNCAVREFEVQVKENNEWKTIYFGNEIGMDFALYLGGVKARSVRVKIIHTEDNRTPAIGLFKVIKSMK
jgi:alpha-L-fucosidase